ncbi:MAG: hypothetical protein AAGC65_03135 [Mucilaginibacter sp.]|uniref:hypothetical protein n=1 Tax=Mucilaginibacter sp. TaxID=1882438 RepID=UPI0031A231D3
MNIFSNYKQGRLIIGLASLLSMSLLTSAPFESNPQNCELVSVIKKNKDGDLAEEDNNLPKD